MTALQTFVLTVLFFVNAGCSDESSNGDLADEGRSTGFPQRSGAGTEQAMLAAGGEDGVFYTLVDEEVSDTPIKTQVVQLVVVSDTPSKAGLRAEISRRYRETLARRGFEHHNPASNIGIYVYGSEEQARAGQGLWVGMLAKSYSNQGDPEVRINEERLAAMSSVPEQRHGPSEAERKNVFRQLAAAEDRGMREAMERVPDSEIMRQIELENQLTEQYRAEVAREHGLTQDQLTEIEVEALIEGWPSR